MKKFRFIILMVLAAWVLGSPKATAQVIVEKKPNPPEQYVAPPPKPGSDYVLIPGHWLWSREHKMYVWVIPAWVPKKEDQQWRPGYWKQLPRGWKWIPGKWERKDRKRW
ncbi:YXWGXW repeat-containing protein [Mangrovibacterium marinum]|uniref:YXWGXW repeat-containing protein n=1 Tax=Mangrovibacterium marinum TaxID=1639118 RepID=A0A2T5C2Z2_9BACT|nr:YXWGXW repeat-containing protein [Mangrovibacterium marinum]PTN09057.1 YXWGXW repeat-containing protein [Mangrovibacterium marinum]